MKSFIQYLAESEQHQHQPLTGDVVSFQINEELEISADVTEVLDEGIVLNLDATALAILENLELIALEEDPQSPRPNLEKLHNLGFENSPAGEQARQNWKTATGETHPAAEDYDIKKQKAQDAHDRLTGVTRTSDRKYSVTVEEDDDGDVIKYWHRLAGPGVKPDTFVDWSPYSTMTTSDLDLYVKLGMPSRDDIGSNGPLHRKDLEKLASERELTEAKYQGRKVQLGKPMKGDVKKFKVYVKNPKTGNVKKVNFGDPNMEIKRDDPKRRKNFRARHGCGTSRASDRTKARYWSCRMWSSKPVSKIVKEATGKPYHLMTPDERILDRIQKNREIDARVAQKQSELTQYWDQKQSDVRTCIIDFNIQLSRYIQRNFVNDPEYRNMPVYAKLEDGHLVIAKPELAAANSREDLRELGYRMITNRQVAGAPDLTQISSMPLKRVLQNGFVLGGRYTLDEKPIIDDYSVSFKTEYHSTVNPSKKEKIQLGTLGFTVAPSYNAPE